MEIVEVTKARTRPVFTEPETTTGPVEKDPTMNVEEPKKTNGKTMRRAKVIDVSPPPSEIAVVEKKSKKAAEKVAAEVTLPLVDASASADMEKVRAERIIIEKKIDTLRTDAARMGWDIGNYLREIYERDLWQDGFTSFGQYVKTRFEFTKQTAFSFMDVSQKFTREQAAELPLTHLRLLVKVPDDDERKALVDKVKEEKPTSRELAAEVKTKREEAGLNTERAGMAESIPLSGRVKPGTHSEGEWSVVRGLRCAELEIGGVKFILEDHKRAGWILKARKPRKE